ncbi:SETMR methyltransferase, partial [Acromyrmex insinuator]
MEKREFRAVIKYLHMKDLMPKKIKAKLDNVHSTSAPAFATVYNWVNKFKRGRTSTGDAPRSGCPIEAATPEIIDKVHDIVLTDRRVKVCELVEATGISHGTVISILHEQLGMKKLSVRWMPRLLSVDHNSSIDSKSRHRDHVTISKQCLEMFQHNPDKFLRRFITQMINGDYYAALDRFNNILKKKRPHLAKKKVFFHQDNARVHTCLVPMAKFNEFRYELFPHPAYSPDLAPCDYFLFPNLKKWKEIQRAAHRRNRGLYFEGLDKLYYSDSLKKLENRWIKCIELKGDYVEK